MSWRGIMIGAIAGFAWLLLIRSLLVAGVISASMTSGWFTSYRTAAFMGVLPPDLGLLSMQDYRGSLPPCYRNCVFCPLS